MVSRLRYICLLTQPRSLSPDRGVWMKGGKTPPMKKWPRWWWLISREVVAGKRVSADSAARATVCFTMSGTKLVSVHWSDSQKFKMCHCCYLPGHNIHFYLSHIKLGSSPLPFESNTWNMTILNALRHFTTQQYYFGPDLSSKQHTAWNDGSLALNPFCQIWARSEPQ